MLDRGRRVQGSSDPMSFEELDPTTRRYILDEFEAEEAGGHPYRAKELSDQGVQAIAGLMRSAIKGGTELTLAASLMDPELWQPWTLQLRRGRLTRVVTNIVHSSERLGITEFNTWYVRGLSKRLLDEGQELCQVYRAAVPKWEPADCAQHEGQIRPIDAVYAGHRRRYWPEPGTPDAISVPFGPSCHHSIRRYRDEPISQSEATG
jgi:hypothetical protein